ncbi:cupin domain-containing protein [Rhizobium halophilum]|uniref:cupin domain-containing protein n=1 Tax=Rhizobium halophilum TaxID=2846852 RepID=UPI001EFD557F|nr:cupin domain-containing protein [Rhizobium halophilum]MCF6370819.1 cupin domain-containing protein [Rhizobium halophilum]
MKPTNIPQAANLAVGPYHNSVLSFVNDHVIRLSVMTEPFHWHHHPNSDEFFQVIEGTMALDLPGQTLLMESGDSYTVKVGTPHRTRPIGGRSVNITCERADMRTVEESHIEHRG